MLMFTALGMLGTPWLLMALFMPHVAIRFGNWLTQHGIALQHAIDNYKVARATLRRERAGNI